MFPVFSLVLDKDVKSEVAMLYPELYKDLLKVTHCLHYITLLAIEYGSIIWQYNMHYFKMMNCINLHNLQSSISTVYTHIYFELYSAFI